MSKKLIVKVRSAFTTVDLILALVVAGLLVGIGIAAVNRAHHRAAEVKLRADVDTLNRAVQAFIASYGDLDDCTHPEEVLARLKAPATAESARLMLGFTGSFVDGRVKGIKQTPDEARTVQPRVVWDTGRRQFAIQSEGPAGIRCFVLDSWEEAAGESMRLNPTMKLAARSNWIWDYTDRMPEKNPDQTGPALKASPPDPVVLASPPPPEAVQLMPPVFSIPDTARLVTEFPLSLHLNDPNPPGAAAKLIYSIDYANWVDYQGAPIQILPGAFVQAQSISGDTSKWLSSRLSAQQHVALPVKLAPPTIEPSGTHFSTSRSAVSVTISDTNPTGRSTLVYRVDGGAWTPYAGPFSIAASSHPFGAKLEARADPIQPYFTASDRATAEIRNGLERLEEPLIVFSANQYGGSVVTIAIELKNPNPPGVSAIHYQIMPVPGGGGAVTPLQEYAGIFSVPQALYPSGFGIRAHAKALDKTYSDSDEAVRFATAYEGVFGGHLDLDTTDFVARINSGKVVNHTHDYTGKYNATSINFFSLAESGHLEIDEAISANGQAFKVLVSNADLSPGMRIVLGFEKNGATSRYSLPVTVYDDISVSDLPIFTLDGTNGTARLTVLEAKFGQDVIFNAGVLPTLPNSSISNVPGKGSEWRNGALTFQAVAINPDGSNAFSTSGTLNGGGVQGVATSGLLWEANLYWHWDGDSYDSDSNRYQPGDFNSIRDHVNVP